jgi:hypothetical protein
MMLFREMKDAGAYYAAVAVADGDYGAHIGITYRCAKRKTLRVLHLASHLKLKDEVPAASKPPWAFFVQPEIDEEDLKLLAVFCTKRARAPQDIPYGFRYADSTFDPTGGRFMVGQGEVGLTCATFVLAMCKWAGIELVDATTWKAQPDDESFKTAMIEALARHADKEHIKALRRDLEPKSPRFRAEEVAACTAFETRPVTFDCAQLAGQAVVERLYEQTKC